jgi:hypothetical protein
MTRPSALQSGFSAITTASNRATLQKRRGRSFILHPPLRLLLGSDAYQAAEKHTMQISAADKEWKDLSISIDRSL